MKLFSTARRTNSTWAGHLEATLPFLDRVDDPFFAEVRRVLEVWFSHYPAESRGHLRNRLLGDAERDSHAASFELLVHEFYWRAGWRAEVEPSIPGTDHRPDFLWTRCADTMIMEARVVSGLSDEAYRAERRRRALYDAIDRMQPHSFYLKLDIEQDGARQPPVKTVIAELERWLATLDADAATAALQARPRFDSAPSRRLEVSGWTLRFAALPVKPELRGRITGRALGALPAETKVFDPRIAIRRAMRDKGGRFGDLEHPYVVALALQEIVVDHDDVRAALLGDAVATIHGFDATQRPAMTRERNDNGYWSARRASGRRVSAVLTIEHPRPWTAPRLEPQLWVNPWASRPYRAHRLWPWTSLDPTGTQLTFGAAETTAAELLRLPRDWPPGSPSCS